MENLNISMESTSDLPKELVKKYDLNVIDMDFMINDNIYSTSTDDVVTTKLYEEMRKGNKTKTSQINQTAYETFFENILNKNNMPIVHLAFSSGLSNTYLSALEASKVINKKHNKDIVFVIDSLCASTGHGMLGILAREYSNKAKSVEDVVDYIENIKLKLNHCFSVEALKYLANGGRIKQTTAIIGTLLNIKPVMKMDDEGKLVVEQKVIGRKKSLQCICDKTKNTYDQNYTTCFISHADCKKDAEYIYDYISKQTTLKPIIGNLGPVIGSHSGPGTISVYFIAKCR